MFELLHAAIKEGLTDLTLYRVDRGWQASSRWRSTTGWRVNIDRSVETALKGALNVQRGQQEETAEDLV